MGNSQSAKASLNLAGSEDIRRIFCHLDDHTAASILALTPTVAQLEEAATRSIGRGSDIFADLRPEKGVVQAIIDLLGMENEELDDR